ncbi:MAG: glycosyltransferase [Bacteroidetes bacterium]|nr:glycosyltransferase [Bacteroidota bacterium]
MHPSTKTNGLFDYSVAYILEQHLPAQRGDCHQALATISTLTAEGLNIKLIIPTKWWGFFTAKEAFKQELLEFYEIQNNFDISRFMYLPFTPSIVDKIFHCLLAPIYAAIRKYDLIYTRNCLIAVIALSLGKKVVLEVFKVYYQDKMSVAKYLARRTNFSNSLSIITHSRLSEESLIEIGAAKEKIRFIPNGFNPDFFTPRLTQSEARKKLGWNEDEKIVCYTGRIDRLKSIDTILELAARTKEIKYVIIGNSLNDTDDWIVHAARRKGLKNIKWKPWAKVGDLPKYLFASDILIIPPSSKPMTKYHDTVLPMKTFIYLAAGRPIIAPDLPDVVEVLNERNSALVEPDNLDLAEKIIRKIFENQSWACSLANQALLDSQNFTWQSRAKRIINFLEEVYS